MQALPGGGTVKNLLDQLQQELLSSSNSERERDEPNQNHAKHQSSSVLYGVDQAAIPVLRSSGNANGTRTNEEDVHIKS